MEFPITFMSLEDVLGAYGISLLIDENDVIHAIHATSKGFSVGQISAIIVLYGRI